MVGWRYLRLYLSAFQITKLNDDGKDQQRVSISRYRASMKDPPEELRLPPGKFTFKSLNHAVSLLAKLLRRLQEILTMRKRK